MKRCKEMWVVIVSFLVFGCGLDLVKSEPDELWTCTGEIGYALFPDAPFLLTRRGFGTGDSREDALANALRIACAGMGDEKEKCERQEPIGGGRYSYNFRCEVE